MGAQGLDSSNPKVRREGPTFYVGGNQCTFDAHNKALMSLGFYQACVNAFITDCYLGPWIVKEVQIMALTKDEEEKQFAEFAANLKELYKVAKDKVLDLSRLDPELAKCNGNPTDLMQYEQMAAGG